MSRRTVAASTAVLALVAAATLTPAPSYAVVSDAYVEASASASELGTAECTISGDSSDVHDETFADDGTWRTVSAASSTTITDPDDPADRTVTSSSSTAQVRATTVTGSLGTLEMRGSTTATRTADQSPSACGVYARASAAVSADVVLAVPGWLTIDLRPTGTEGGSVEIESAEDFTRRITVDSSDGSVTARVYRPAGIYDVTATTSIFHGGSGTLTGSLEATITFAPAGSASSAATGAGRAYVALPDQITCAGGTAVLQLPAKGKALKKLKKAVFTGTGAKAVKLKKLKPGRKVTLTGLVGTGPVTVAAAFTKDNGKVVEVERDYTACS